MPTIKIKQKGKNSKVVAAVVVAVVVAVVIVVVVRTIQGVYSLAEPYYGYSELSTLLLLKSLSFLVFPTWNFELKNQYHLSFIL